MAPKKKKKAASNPARGFATVSLPSRGKEDGAPSEAGNVRTDSKDDRSTSTEAQTASNDAKPSEEPSSLQDMTPDQLEEHLENAELLNLLENYGERSKRDAARQIARLETERRTLRAQAVPLETADWITQDLENEILDLSRTSTSILSGRAQSVTGDMKTMQQDELLIRLWTLQQVLRSMQIKQEEQVLKHIVSLKTHEMVTPKDYIWGLEESLDWLAYHTDPEELPQYNMASNVPLPHYNSMPPSSSEASQATSPVRNAPTQPFIPSVVKSTPTGMHGKGRIEESSDTQPVYSVDSCHSSDDDNDPDRLIGRYLDLRSRLLKYELGCAENKHTVNTSQAQERLSTSQVNRLRQKVKDIENDILFDQDKADAHWNDTSSRIRSELAELRRTRRETHSDDVSHLESDLVIAPEDEPHEMSDIDAAAEPLFGDMFTTGEKYGTGSDNSPRPENGNTTALVDFGKWSGISPRRVLEEACRARDPQCKLSFQLISSSSYSNRHSLEVNWSRPQKQQILFSALPKALSYAFDARCINVHMQTIATPTAVQSEAYISTITLFALSAGEAKDEKVFLRLPAVWRDLWSELLEKRRVEVATTDRCSLKKIRTIINECTTPGEDDNDELRLTIRRKLDADDGTAQESYASNLIQHTPEQLQSDWEKKTSTQRYHAMLCARQLLPIFEQRENILHSIDQQQVTILCAETGAGKSTQVPAFVLEHEMRSGRDCRILVTQPRRISAISLAKRASEELGEVRNDIGTHRSLVGYAIRLESKVTSATRITYATTGVLLRMLEGAQDLPKISHLILDEVHERTLDLDLAFIAIRRILAQRPNLKVILMSATVDAAKFSRYFGDAPIMAVPGRTYPVEVKYLEDAIEDTLAQYKGDISETWGTELHDQIDDLDEDEQRVRSAITGLEHYNSKTRAIIAAYDEYRMDYSLITNLAAVIASHEVYSKYSRAILIFMPGIAEIRRLHNTFLSHDSFRKGWSFFMLHSSFSSEDLELAFMPPPPGTRKIVIATNIAETGITIPDITAVIDTCKEKTMRFDERRQISKLTENFTSKSSCRQRRGRAARVQDGICFHLLTRYRFEMLLPEQHVPEMLRLSLQDPALRIKVWDFGDIEGTLAQAIDPPTSKNIKRAVDALKDSKALSSSETLTPLGRQLARLPLDIWLGKLAILGFVFGCLDAGVTIASIVHSKSPFLASNKGDSCAENAKLNFKRGDSDLLLTYNVYVSWRRASGSGRMGEFCKKHFLDQQALLQIEDQKVQLLVALADARLLNLDETEKSKLLRARSSGRNREFFTIPDRFDMNNGDDNALTSLIAVAFYPKLLAREGKGWRNISTNQQVNLAPTSVNKTLARPPTWLSFYQTMQTKSKLPNVFDTSAVPESAIVILLGDADFKMFAGVVSIDGNKIRFRVRTWKIMIALKMLRAKVNDLLSFAIQSPGKAFPAALKPWAGLWQKVLAPVEQDIRVQSTTNLGQLVRQG